MNKTPRTQLVAYGVAVLATGISLLLRWPLFPLLGLHAPNTTFFPAIILSAYLGGLGPGLLATVLGAAAGDYFLYEPQFTFAIEGPGEAYALGMFVLAGAFISGLTESLHRSRRRIAANERRYAVTLGSIGDAVIATDTQARVTFLNPAAEVLTGWPLADAIGRPLAEVFRIVNEQTRQTVEDPAAKVLRLGTVVGLANHTVLLARDGRETPIDDCGAPIIDERGGVTGVVLVFRDVSQRRRAEEAEVLRRSQARLDLAVRGSRIGILEVDMPDGMLENAQLTTSNVWELLGYEANEGPTTFPGRIALIHPDDQERFQRAIQTYLSGDSGEFEVEDRNRHKDGSYRWLLTRGVAVRDAAGRAVRFIGTSVDISELKRAEEALARERFLLHSLMDNLPDNMYFKDAAGRFIRISNSLTTYFGLNDPSQAIGKTDFDFFAEEHARSAYADEQVIIQSGQPIVGKEEKETWLDGRVRWLLTTIDRRIVRRTIS